MIDDDETRVLGLRGLFVEARRRGDAEAARDYATEAARLAPSVDLGQRCGARGALRRGRLARRPRHRRAARLARPPRQDGRAAPARRAARRRRARPRGRRPRRRAGERPGSREAGARPRPGGGAGGTAAVAHGRSEARRAGGRGGLEGGRRIPNSPPSTSTSGPGDSALDRLQPRRDARKALACGTPKPGSRSPARPSRRASSRGRGAPCSRSSTSGRPCALPPHGRSRAGGARHHRPWPRVARPRRACAAAIRPGSPTASSRTAGRPSRP